MDDPSSLSSRSKAEQNSNHSETVRILVLVRVAAGPPILIPDSDFACFDTSESIEISRRLLPARIHAREFFAVEVEGDGMIDAFIRHGDLAIMGPVARNWKPPIYGEAPSDIVIVYLPRRSEAALAYLYQQNDDYRLEFASPSIRPILIRGTEQPEVKGKLVLVIRSKLENPGR